jgi:hypothetical protein
MSKESDSRIGPQECYLVWAHDFALAGLTEGRSLEEIAEATDVAELIGERLPMDRLPKQHRDTVAKIAQELP